MLKQESLMEHSEEPSVKDLQGQFIQEMRALAGDPARPDYGDWQAKKFETIDRCVQAILATATDEEYDELLIYTTVSLKEFLDPAKNYPPAMKETLSKVVDRILSRSISDWADPDWRDRVWPQVPGIDPGTLDSDWFKDEVPDFPDDGSSLL